MPPIIIVTTNTPKLKWVVIILGVVIISTVIGYIYISLKSNHDLDNIVVTDEPIAPTAAQIQAQLEVLAKNNSVTASTTPVREDVRSQLQILSKNETATPVSKSPSQEDMKNQLEALSH